MLQTKLHASICYQKPQNIKLKAFLLAPVKLKSLPGLLFISNCYCVK